MFYICFNSILFILLLLGGSTSDKLQEVYKPVLTDAACTSYLSNAYNANTMLCAGLDIGGKDACQVNTLFAFALLCLVMALYTQIFILTFTTKETDVLLINVKV